MTVDGLLDLIPSNTYEDILGSIKSASYMEGGGHQELS